jgi:hypothetical protein
LPKEIPADIIVQPSGESTNIAGKHGAPPDGPIYLRKFFNGADAGDGIDFCSPHGSREIELE